MSEYYSRDGIMIYRNGFRIAECDTEELAENILNHLQSPQEVENILWKLYEEIKHGDETHQEWLKEKIASFIKKNL